LDPFGSARTGVCFPLVVTLPLALAAGGEDSVHAPGQEADREELRAERRALHTRLGLPLNRPVLRFTCALRLGPQEGGALTSETPQQQQGRLRDVHVGLPASGVPAATAHLVQGPYFYFHYGQDLDDRGWGCAYRSLQTIVSFFRLNGYTTKPVPSHREVQQVLVNMGAFSVCCPAVLLCCG